MAAIRSGRVNDYVLSVILGIVEGLTEFLPVSSTAHLRIAEALLHIDLASGYWKMYTIVIQLGAILTLPIYFRHRIAKFLSTFPKGERGDRTVLTHPLSLVTIAFVVTAIPAFLMTKIIGKHLESLYIMGCALLIGGIVMWFIDASNSKAEAAGEGSQDRTDSHVAHGRYEPGTGSVDRSVPDPVGGVSGDIAVDVDDRSRTIGGDVARVGVGVFLFSFDPDDGGGDGVRLAEIAGGEECESDRSGEIDAHGWIVLAIGFVVSFIVAYGTVAWFMAWVRKRGFGPFAIYRIVVGIWCSISQEELASKVHSSSVLMCPLW